MKELHNLVRAFFLAVLAGVAISIGGCVFLSIDNKVIGALMFCVGLYSICVHGLKLYTGKIGYIITEDSKLMYCLELLVIWIGNLLGTVISAYVMNMAQIAGISEKASKMCGVKLGNSLPNLFLLGCFCGFLMFVAVDGYKQSKNPIIIFMGVATFILCGFEHCIADMYYFSISGMWSGKTFLCVLMITLGNSLGAILIPLAKKFPKQQDT